MERRSPTDCTQKQEGTRSRLGKDPTTEDQQIPDELTAEWLSRKRKALPEKLSTLRQKLYQKAKQEPKFRFYALYDRIYRRDVLQAAWEQVAGNKGAPGPDGVTIDQIVRSEGGAERLVEQLHEELSTKRYKPGAVRRVYIPKPDGRKRPLGIPNIRDRVAQMAALLVLEPIFEADFEDCSFGFRPERSAHDALAEIRLAVQEGRAEVLDADLKGYFDTIPHDKLMAAIRMRITDSSVLKLIKMWLTAVVIDEDERGRPKGHRPKTGTPQGGVISPLLANIVLHWFDRTFLSSGPGKWANAKLVRYADDFVVLARFVGRRIIDWVEYFIETRMGLVINRDKTRVIDLKEKKASLDFLGFTFRFDRDLFGRPKKYLNVVPSKKALAKEREEVRSMTTASSCFVAIPHLIRRVNRQVEGWANYFSFGYPRVAFRKMNRFVRERLTRHLQRRSQRPFRPPQGVSFHSHLKKLGLVYL